MKRTTIKHPLDRSRELTIYVAEDITRVMQMRVKRMNEDIFQFGCGVDIAKLDGGNTILMSTIGAYALEFTSFVKNHLRLEYAFTKTSGYGHPYYYESIEEVFFCDDPIFSTPNQPIDGSALFLKSDNWQDIDKSEFIND